MEWQVFRFRGEEIPDIRKWAEERGERIVRFKRIKKVVTWFYTNTFPKETFSYEEAEGIMPESFWNNLKYSDGYEYHFLAYEGPNEKLGR